MVKSPRRLQSSQLIGLDNEHSSVWVLLERRRIRTILRHEGVVRRVKIYEPVPVGTQAEKDGGAVEHGGESGWSPAIGEIRLADHMHVAGGSEHRNGADIEGERAALFLRGG